MSGNNNNIDGPESTNWLSESEQQFWFDQFKSPETDGLRFKKFQEFLGATLYEYFATYSRNNETLVDEEFQGKTSQNGGNQFTHQQEMQLFKAFDQKNDHILDFDEFSFMCQKWLDKVYRPSRALVIVDVQNDFIDGSLALINGPAGQDGAEVVPIINNLLEANQFKAVVYTQDWHPADHIGFHANLHMRKHQIKEEHASGAINGETDLVNKSNNLEVRATSLEPLKYKKTNPKAQVFDTVLFDEGRVEQKLWPTHCVQDSWGAQLHPKLKLVPDAIRIQKGTLSHVDAYSAFWDNMRLNETGLRQDLQSRKISDLYFCGLALDYCVAASAIDAAKAGFITFVIEDACRGIDLEGIELKKMELKDCGVLIISSEEVPGLLNGSGQFDRRKFANCGTKSCSSKSVIDCSTIKTICFRRALL